MEHDEAGILVSVLEQRFKGHWQEDDTKISKDATKVTAQLLQTFIEEAVARATLAAKDDDHSIVEASHLEKVLPQLLLDF
mmetsp:Transcript_36137/g.56440  ORF Transcript_36137/g.56440 Transcript_36137/m.56440 type:complete len:80 (-) Transcript_36137:1304-1543(-)